MALDIKESANIVMRILLNKDEGEYGCLDDFRQEGYTSEELVKIYKYIKERTPVFIDTYLNAKDGECAKIIRGKKDEVNSFMNTGGYKKFDYYLDYQDYISKEKGKLELRIDKQDKHLDYTLKADKNWRTPNIIAVVSALAAVCSLVWTVTRPSDSKNISEIRAQLEQQQDAQRRLEQTNTMILHNQDSLWKIGHKPNGK